MVPNGFSKLPNDLFFDKASLKLGLIFFEVLPSIQEIMRFEKYGNYS